MRVDPGRTRPPPRRPTVSGAAPPTARPAHAPPPAGEHVLQRAVRGRVGAGAVVRDAARRPSPPVRRPAAPCVISCSTLTAVPPRATWRRTIASQSAWCGGSRLASGSSISSSGACTASARASSTRWRSPPDRLPSGAVAPVPALGLAASPPATAARSACARARRASAGAAGGPASPRRAPAGLRRRSRSGPSQARARARSRGGHVAAGAPQQVAPGRATAAGAPAPSAAWSCRRRWARRWRSSGRPAAPGHAVQHLAPAERHAQGRAARSAIGRRVMQARSLLTRPAAASATAGSRRRAPR